MEKISDSFTPLYGYQDIGLIAALILGWLISQKSLAKPLHAGFFADRFKVDRHTIYRSVKALNDNGYIDYQSIPNVGIKVNLTDKSKELKDYFKNGKDKPSYITANGFLRVFSYEGFHLYENVVMSYIESKIIDGNTKNIRISIYEMSKKFHIGRKTISDVLTDFERRGIFTYTADDHNKNKGTIITLLI